LYEALDYGFTSIEVDVYWHDGRMVVTHDDKKLDEKPTIQELYLDPLKTITQNNGGHVFEKSTTPLVLMVDLKSDKEATYKALREIFQHYLDIIEWHEGEELITGPVKVVLSGNPPVDLIQNQQKRYFSIDGSVEQWGEDYPSDLMPRASTNYRTYFKWYGKGEIPADELRKMRDLIDLAHSKNRKIRFWGCPNRVEVWEKLMDEGVDWINVDDLQGFNAFYRKRMSNN
jgi:glycerophosphoryl diester phosphodiesterase